ncbi:MAG: hypothetical protein MUF34_34185 [Polyangiaceae bacterium]|nr:hypothetical protein [Polyangiaceae bacterium]
MTGKYLNRKWSGPRGDGLLVAPDASGDPAPGDPKLVEAQAYGASIGAPRGANPGALATWDGWLATFGLPDAQPGEPRPAYRARTGTAVFYNQYETGLGHELGCRPLPAPSTHGSPSARGVACFLVNYGARHAPERSLSLAREGAERLNAFGITYRPDFKPEGADGYEVQFYAYDADGQRLDWARLDTMGPRPIPEVCLSCHGGSYDRERHLVRYARFLPIHVENLIFASPNDAPGARTEDPEQVAPALNELIALTPLTPRQRAALGGADGGEHDQARLGYRAAIPAGWRGGPEREDLYERVISPFCSSCHDAEMHDVTGGEKPIYKNFESYAAFLDSAIPASLCGTFSMPNTQAGLARFWATSDEGVVVRDARGTPRRYGSPADALLAAFGRSRGACEGLTRESDCRAQSDSVCGDQASGARCGESGTCEPPARVEVEQR